MDKIAIINRLKEIKQMKADKDFAEFLGISRQTLSNWKSRNSLDFDLIFEKFKGLNFHWIVTGQGDKIMDFMEFYNLPEIYRNNKAIFIKEVAPPCITEEQAKEVFIIHNELYQNLIKKEK